MSKIGTPAAFLLTTEADGPALERISEKFFQKYGRIFLVRRGKHRMKTFARVMEDTGWQRHSYRSGSSASYSLQLFFRIVSAPVALLLSKNIHQTWILVGYNVTFLL